MSSLSSLLHALSPELCITLGALGVLAIDMVSGDPCDGRVRRIRLLVVLASLLSVVACFNLWAGPLPVGLFPRSDAEGGLGPTAFTVDNLAVALKVLIGLLTALTVLVSEGRFEEEQRNAGEYYALLLFAALGMQVAVSASEFLTFFVAFELFSIPLYTLAAMRRYRAES
ncbi:MAG: hypothetical protein AB1758_30800, partial [Candidatus Eremiobacterota bacterium]